MSRVKSEVLSFIEIFKRYPETVDLFTNCACYWFAKILHERFPSSYIVYNPVDIHFATCINGDVYDITGILETTEYCPWFDWEEYKGWSLDADEIERTCVLMSN